jgi:hydrogenase maturation protease
MNVVVAVGNEFRRDDGVALAVADALRDRVPDGTQIVRCEQEPSRLLDAWEGATAAFVVDAAASGAKPGTVRRFDASERPVPAGVFRSSTHAFGVGDAVELARALGTLPPLVVVYGVAGGDFGAGRGLSEPVARAVVRVAELLAADLAAAERKGEPCTNER